MYIIHISLTKDITILLHVYSEPENGIRDITSIMLPMQPFSVMLYDVAFPVNYSDISCQKDRMATLINHLYTQRR